MKERELGYAFGVSKASVSAEQLSVLIKGKSPEYQDGAKEGHQWAQTQEDEAISEEGESSDEGGFDRPSFGGGGDDFGGGPDMRSDTSFGDEDEPLEFGDSKKTDEMIDGKRIDDDESEDLEIVEEDGDLKIATRYTRSDLDKAKEDLEEDPEKKILKKDGDDILVVEDDENEDFELSQSDIPRDSRHKKRRRSLLMDALSEIEAISDGYVGNLEEKSVTAVKKKLGEKVSAKVDSDGYAVSKKQGLFAFSKAWATDNVETCVKVVREILSTSGVIFSDELLVSVLSEALDVDSDVALCQINPDALKEQAVKFLTSVIKVSEVE